jgi:methylated-DNA-[protein]-cysteine S-methyltransferase
MTDSATTRLAARAAAEGLLDVAYTTIDSPFGDLLLAATPRGLVRLGLPNQSADELLQDLARRVSPRVLETPAGFDEARRELDLYFEGRLRDFELPLDWRLSKDFRRRALRTVARIPYGETRSYMQVAKSAGNERAVRAAGSACGSNPIPIVVPCHRVLRTGGGLGGYGGGLPMKRALLGMEGALDEEPAG